MNTIKRNSNWAEDICYIIKAEGTCRQFPAHSKEQRDRVMARWTAKGLKPVALKVVD